MLYEVITHLGAVRILLEYLAKAYLKDTKGKTAFDYARENGHFKVARIIEGSLEVLNEAAKDASYNFV